MAQLPLDSQEASASHVALLLTGGTCGARLGTDPLYRRPGGCHDIVGHQPSAGFDAVDGRDGEGDVLGAGSAGVLDDVAARCSLPGLRCAAVDAGSGMRAATIVHPDAGDHDLHALDDRRRRRGTTLSSCWSGAPAAASSRPTVGAARRWSLVTPPSLMCTCFALTTGSAMPASGKRLARETPRPGRHRSSTAA